MSSFDPVLLAVIANRLDSIVREMENTLLRSGRSAVLNMARDFSCALITGDNRLLASAEGLPVHVIGMEFLAEAVTDLHDDLADGDAFLHNDPYLGNTHPGRPRHPRAGLLGGTHVFTAAAKAHQADCGNAQPTTYMPYARDVYEEGSLIFPAVRVQRDYRDIDDIIRMCRRRIRVPDQWYGDYLAMVGAARIGEARLKELCAKYGRETLDAVRRGVVRLLGAADRARDLADAEGHDRRPRLPRSVRPRAGRHPDQGQGRPSIRTPGMIELDLTRQHRLPAGGRERVAHVRDEQLHDGRLQLDRPGHPAQRRHVPAGEGEAARELRRRHPDASRTPARWRRRTWASGSSSRPSARSPTRGTATASPRAPAGSAPASRSSPAPTTARATTPYVNQKFLGSQGGPAGPEHRRLDHVRQRRHERPHVPRQRRDRRAQVPDPRARAPHPPRLRGRRPATRRAGNATSPTGRSATR